MTTIVGKRLIAMMAGFSVFGGGAGRDGESFQIPIRLCLFVGMREVERRVQEDREDSGYL